MTQSALSLENNCKCELAPQERVFRVDKRGNLTCIYCKGIIAKYAFTRLQNNISNAKGEYGNMQRVQNPKMV
jgi:hypothetical protein